MESQNGAKVIYSDFSAHRDDQKEIKVSEPKNRNGVVSLEDFKRRQERKRGIFKVPTSKDSWSIYDVGIIILLTIWGMILGLIALFVLVCLYPILSLLSDD